MIQVKDNIYWLGVRDWESRTFHGQEMSTVMGTTYNSYIIRDKKTALIDTCKINRKEEFLDILGNEVGFDNIDMIIINHSEPDHGGMLDEVLKKTGMDTPVYCTEMGKRFMTRTFSDKINFQVVKTGDEISLGETTLRFIEMKMIHWPDSMMVYAEKQKVLLSNDAFGQHVSAAGIFDDQNDECDIFYEALKYYVNILTPLNRFIKRKLEEIISMGLVLDCIAPSHGVIWRSHVDKILKLYGEWSAAENNGTVAVVYDTMYGTTAAMAAAIGRGLENEGVNYRIYNVSAYDTSDLITDIFLAGGLIIGSPTLHNAPLGSIAGFLEGIKMLKFTGKLGAAFGAYAWSGEACKTISRSLIDAGFKVELEPISVMLKANDDEIAGCVKFGEEFAKLIKR